MRLSTLALACIVGCSSGGGSVSASTHCSDDSNCGPGQRCDVDTGQCVEGIGRDNHLTGTVSCKLDALDDASVALGKAFVTGAIAGKSVEMSIGGGCGVDTGQVTIVVSAGKGHPQLGLVAPAKVLAAPGEFAIEPYVNWIDNAKHAWAVVKNQIGDHPAPSDVDSAFGIAGKVTVKAGATKKGDVLEISLDLDLALPKEIQACDASCVSQADCGVGAGSEGFDYPVCEEDYEGGPRVCRILCDASGAGCTAHGGHCSGPACTRKGCGDLSGGVDCKTLDATNCDTCCDLKNAEANTQNLALIVDTCGCAAGSPCESECKPTCTKHDVGSYEACLNCLTTDAAHTCFTAALKKCAADPACSAYHECVNACPM